MRPNMITASPKGHALLNVSDKNQEVETLRRNLSAQFRKSAGMESEETPPAAKV